MAIGDIRVLVVDDHAMFREGLARSLEREADMKVVGQFSSSSESLRALSAASPDVVLLDVDLGAEKAVDFVIGARKAGFQGRILVITAGASNQEAVELIQAGVSGIMHKHHSTTDLCGAIRQVFRGEVCLEENYLGPLFRSVDRSRPATGVKLTDRDKMVLRLILKGLSNREISARLDITEGAAKASLQQLFGKLGVRTRAQLVKVALEQYRDQL
jgi:two-component system nitrate/nitrite response regulator NarL